MFKKNQQKPNQTPLENEVPQSKDDALFETLNRNKKEKRRRIIRTVIIIILILAVILVAGVSILQRRVRAKFASNDNEVLSTAADIEVTRSGDVWTLEGSWLDRLVARTNFTDNESRMYFDRKLRENGVYERLEEMGIEDGEFINIQGMEFEYRS